MWDSGVLYTEFEYPFPHPYRGPLPPERLGAGHQQYLEEQKIRDGAVDAMKAELEAFEKELEAQKAEKKRKMQEEMKAAEGASADG
jgi:hypothetical protein